MNTDPVESVEPIKPPAMTISKVPSARDIAKAMRAEGATLQKIANCLGLTRQRVHQLVKTVSKPLNPCRGCGKPTRAKVCTSCKSKTGYRRLKPCDCGCGQMININWRYTQECLARVLTEQPKSAS